MGGGAVRAPVIRAAGLGKQYRIGERQPYKSLRDSIMRALSRGVRHRSRSSQELIWALRDVSFAIHEGEVVGIIGRNGAGKSTLLKILSRITEPTEGRAELCGRVGSLLDVGTGFHPELTGRENIYLNGAILGMKRAEIERRFDEIVAFAEVERFLDTPLKHYSSGMYLRLAFAVAAHLDPEILLVDEVLAVGDVEFQKKCLGKMGEVARGGRTVLFVSHNLAAIRSLCSRGIVLAQGRLVFDGPAGDAVEAYLSRLAETAEGEGGTLRFVRRPPPCAPPGAGFTVECVEVLAESGAVRTTLSTGDYACFRITFHSPEGVEKGGVELGIHTLDGVRLIQYSTRPVSNLELNFAPGRNVVECEFPRFPLAAGSYVLSVALTRPGLEWLFVDDHYATLEVLGREVEAGGVAVTSQRCLLVAEHRWRLPASWREEEQQR
ncbi:MAG: ABC transporter ATP-binding protein [Thermoanaerobaculaceae bacterium]|nr:ABC transporter ATP-binding protein [Thermoanaerobaculaceae bacterium]